MLRRSILFLSALIVFSFAVAHQDGGKKAEDQFKNIQSFKGVPADEIFPAMHFMSNALGVGCDYCHTDDRASDSKEEKGTARRMIAMTKEINEKNFNGRNQVTCATCHGGHSNPNGQPPVVGMSRGFRRDANLSVKQVFDKYAVAIGGEDAASKLQSVHLAGVSSHDKDSEDIDVYQAAPDRVLLKTNTKQGTRTMGYDGTTAWFTQGSESQKLSMRTLAVYLRQGRQYRTGLGAGYENSAAGTGPLNGKTMNIVRGTSPANHMSEMLYFDPASGLLARVIDSDETILGRIPTIYDLSDYRKVGGVLVPFKVVMRNSQGDFAITFRHGDANPKISGDMFSTKG